MVEQKRVGDITTVNESMPVLKLEMQVEHSVI